MDQAKVRRKEAVVDASESAQLAAITASFDEASKAISDLKHPQKRGMKAVESFDILPDDTTWTNSYVAVKFAERPSASSSASSNPLLLAPSDDRLRRALLRPQQGADGAFMSVYFASDASWTPEILETLPVSTTEMIEAANAHEGEESDRPSIPVSLMPTTFA